MLKQSVSASCLLTYLLLIIKHSMKLVCLCISTSFTTRWWPAETTRGWWWRSHLAENYSGNSTRQMKWMFTFRGDVLVLVLTFWSSFHCCWWEDIGGMADQGKHGLWYEKDGFECLLWYRSGMLILMRCYECFDWLQLLSGDEGNDVLQHSVVESWEPAAEWL